tara:strand:+ start:25781 stop:26179 length:399 start_codon:yes stop_codon:yes gene_type:complete
MENKTITIPYNEYKGIEKKLLDHSTTIQNLEEVISGDSVLRVEINPHRYYEAHKCIYYGNEDFLSQLSEIKELNDRIHDSNKRENSKLYNENLKLNEENRVLKIEQESLKIKNIKLNDKLKNITIFQLIFGN